jgi:hypothetical protein
VVGLWLRLTKHVLYRIPVSVLSVAAWVTVKLVKRRPEAILVYLPLSTNWNVKTRYVSCGVTVPHALLYQVSFLHTIDVQDRQGSLSTVA